MKGEHRHRDWRIEGRIVGKPPLWHSERIISDGGLPFIPAAAFAAAGIS